MRTASLETAMDAYLECTVAAMGDRRLASPDSATPAEKSAMIDAAVQSCSGAGYNAATHLIVEGARTPMKYRRSASNISEYAVPLVEEYAKDFLRRYM